MDPYEVQSEFLKAFAHPTRLAILDILKDGEQCVCHMEATLGLRQAYISQQLMPLKNAGLVESRRDGLPRRTAFGAHLELDVLAALQAAAGVRPTLPQHRHANNVCPCPKCSNKTETTLIQIEAL